MGGQGGLLRESLVSSYETEIPSPPQVSPRSSLSLNFSEVEQAAPRGPSPMAGVAAALHICPPALPVTSCPGCGVEGLAAGERSRWERRVRVVWARPRAACAGHDVAPIQVALRGWDTRAQTVTPPRPSCPGALGTGSDLDATPLSARAQSFLPAVWAVGGSDTVAAVWRHSSWSCPRRVCGQEGACSLPPAALAVSRSLPRTWPCPLCPGTRAILPSSGTPCPSLPPWGCGSRTGAPAACAEAEPPIQSRG